MRDGSDGMANGAPRGRTLPDDRTGRRARHWKLAPERPAANRCGVLRFSCRYVFPPTAPVKRDFHLDEYAFIAQDDGATFPGTVIPSRKSPTPRPRPTRPTRVDPFAGRTRTISSIGGGAPGVSAYYLLAPFEGSDPAARDRALRCLEEVGAAMKLPPPPSGGWAQVRIPVRSR